MAEAQKMMANPEFKKQMGNLAASGDLQEKMKDVNALLKDPAKAAEMEAKMEHMMKIGTEQLKQQGNVMEDAMATMQDPAVMQQINEMMKDPKFQQQISQMASDPSYKGYIDAMQDMMKDPTKKAQMEEIGRQMRKEL